MCEFCTKHGEGKKWYLLMKNYSEELVFEELSSVQKEISGVSTRKEWMERSFRDFVIPAIGIRSGMQHEPQGEQMNTEIPGDQAHEFTVQDFDRLTNSHSEYNEQEIVVRRQVEHFGQVLPIEDAEAVVDQASSITRLPCGCRYLSTGKTDKRYCFGLGLDRTGVMGMYPDAVSSLEVLDKVEVKKVLRRFDEEGLMHSIWTGVTPYIMGICNCDRDCLACNNHFKGGPATFFRAEYVCQVDFNLCNGCKDCMRQCQFGAQQYSSALSKVYIHPLKCIGCGVCRAACSRNAITLVSRQYHPQAAKIWLDTPLGISHLI